jgi:hypothetical protein
MMNTCNTQHDPRCGYCGRPILGPTVYGNSGAYHPDCTRPPKLTIDDLMRFNRPNTWEPYKSPKWEINHVCSNPNDPELKATNSPDA